MLILAEGLVQGCPEPKFEETGFFTATFFPNPAVRARVEAQKYEQSPSKLAPSWP